MSDLEQQLRSTFRVAELDRRAARRQVILNEAKLLDEDHSDAETQAALARLREAARMETTFRMQSLWDELTLWQRLKAAVTRVFPPRSTL